MSFSSKNITQTTKRGISFLKGATFFFLGMSLVLFVTKAFEVVPTTQNFVSYFQKMFLTPDGFNTPSSETVILDGVAGDAFFAGTVTGTTVNATTVNATTVNATTVCLSTDPGTPCRTTWPTGGVSSANAAGNTTNIQFNGDGTNFSGSDDLVRDSTNGRLGIGTSSPSKELDVYGTGSFSEDVFIDGGNLLFGQGEKYIHLPIRTAGIGGNSPGHHLSIKAGDSSDNSAALTSGGNLYLQGGDVSSPGGGFYVAGNEQGGNVYIDGGGGAGIHGNVLLAYSGGNVGIGTATPSYKLDVDGSGRFNNNLVINGTTTVNDNVNFNVGNAYASRAGYGFLGKGSLGNEFGLMGISDDYIAVKDGSTYKYGNDGSLNILSNGNVGIGTNNPLYKLDVHGTGSFSGVCLSGYCRSTWPVGGGDSIWSTGSSSVIFYNSGKVGIGTGNPQAKLHISNGDLIIQTIRGSLLNSSLLRSSNETGYNAIVGGYIDNPLGVGWGIGVSKDRTSGTGSLGLGTTNHSPITIFSSGLQRMTVASNGYIGIGTTDPTERLQVGDYAWIGSDTNTQQSLSKTGGVFLRLYGISPIGSSQHPPKYNPNIQLNYYDRTGTPYLLHNWMIDAGSSLSFDYGTGGGYNDMLSITNVGNIKIGSGKIIYATSSDGSNQIFLAGNGNVGIGKANPSTVLHVDGDVTADAYYYSSDERLKTDIVTITNPLEKILALNGYLFTWKETGRRDMGVIAQEVEKIFPEIVSTNNEGYKSVEYGNLVAPLIEAIKELNAKVDQQNQEIQSLKQLIQ